MRAAGPFCVPVRGVVCLVAILAGLPACATHRTELLPISTATVEGQIARTRALASRATPEPVAALLRKLA